MNQLALSNLERLSPLSNSDRSFCEQITCAGTHHAKYHTLQLARAVLAAGIPGDFAECGVMAGAHPAIMEFALRAYPDDRRKIHLFDCFEGIPPIGPHDLPESAVIEGQSKCSVEQVLENLRLWGCDLSRFQFHAGLFEKTLAKDAQEVGKLAILRVDVDLYSSTHTVYEHLYGKVVAGGVIVDDDWGLVDGPPPPCRLAAMDQIVKHHFFKHPGEILDVPGNIGTAFWRKPCV